MVNKQSNKTEKRLTLKQTDPEKYAFLKAEAAAPYRSLRQFIYLGVAASGAIGAFIFFTQLLADQEITSTLPNLALQIGVVTLMIWLFRLENKLKRKSGL
jgi:hypothetical protein